MRIALCLFASLICCLRIGDLELIECTFERRTWKSCTAFLNRICTWLFNHQDREKTWTLIPLNAPNSKQFEFDYKWNSIPDTRHSSRCTPAAFLMDFITRKCIVNSIWIALVVLLLWIINWLIVPFCHSLLRICDCVNVQRVTFFSPRHRQHFQHTFIWVCIYAMMTY